MPTCTINTFELEKMRILHIIPSMNPKLGGPAQGIRNYEFGLKTIGGDIHRDIVCFDKQEEAQHWITGELNVFALGEANNALRYHPKFKAWLRTYLSHYDAVIINGLWQYHSYATNAVIRELKAKGKKVPRVYVMTHGMLDPWFQKAESRKLKAIRNSIYWHLIEKRVINTADGVLFTCEQELQLAKTTFDGYNPKAEINVGYGIAPPPAYHERMKTAFLANFPFMEDKPYLLFLSRIDPKKGVDLLLQAYKQLRQSTDIGVIPELVIAGPGLEDAYGKEMVNYVHGYPELAEHVHFVGMLSDDVKWGAIYGSEAFVLPSHQENFGIAVAEALACGKPVLISNQVNIWNEIESMGAGLIAEDTIDGTFNLLNTFMNLTTEEKKAMAVHALTAYAIFFDVRITAKKLIEYVF